MIVLTFVVFSQYSGPRAKAQEKSAVRRGGGKSLREQCGKLDIRPAKGR
jgi:hypothetical protein